MSERQYAVYIMCNWENTVLYIGVTNNLGRRVLEHEDGELKGFTQKYNCKKLVYYEVTESVHVALEREKQLKRWHKDWKKNLIKEANPTFENLKDEVLSPF